MNYVYSIRDAATEAFSPPIIVRAQGEAIRMFVDEAQNPDSRIKKHPQDFDLYKVGEWDDQTGELSGQKPERVARAQDYTGGN